MNTLATRRHPLALPRGPQHNPARHRTMLVTKAGSKERISKGFNVMEWTGGLVPQGLLVTGVQESCKLAWTTLVRELAPQDKDGGYYRQKAAFNGRICSAQFPVSARCAFRNTIWKPTALIKHKMWCIPVRRQCPYVAPLLQQCVLLVSF